MTAVTTGHADVSLRTRLSTLLTRRELPRRIALTVLGLLAAGWLVGALLFLRADGSVTWTLPVQAAAPRGEHNLASYRYGPTLRASSYYREPYEQNHPVFLVDERADPSSHEKWSSAPSDRAPWTEVLFARPATIERVVIRHAGSREAKDLTMRTYRLQCLGMREKVAPLQVHDNQANVARHELRCTETRGVRIEWMLVGPDARALVYELEVWGR